MSLDAPGPSAREAPNLRLRPLLGAARQSRPLPCSAGVVRRASLLRQRRGALMSAAGAVSAALLYLVCQTSVEVMGLEPRSRRRPNSLADAVDAHNDTELRTSSHAISGVMCSATRTLELEARLVTDHDPRRRYLNWVRIECSRLDRFPTQRDSLSVRQRRSIRFAISVRWTAPRMSETGIANRVVARRRTDE
jgi:hypothetical protein